MLSTAIAFATSCHSSTNHTYDGKPYAYHLNMVAEAGLLFVGKWEETQREIILSACWCHDVIEDTRQTYNDVKKVLGVEIADLVYALTNEKGRTRAERANEAYYRGIRETPFATLVKVCDRIANVTHSKSKGTMMFEKYKAEYPDFRKKLYVPGEYEEAWLHLDRLCKEPSQSPGGLFV